MKDELLFENIKAFMNSNQRNSWILGDYSKAFIRKSKRWVNEKWYDCFDLAAIEISEEFRNKGILKNLLTDLISWCDRSIFVESVQNPILEKYLLKIGFFTKNDTDEVKNFFLIK